jgi:peroxiredoxin
MAHNKFAIWFGLAVLTAGLLIGCKEKPQNGGQQAADSKKQTANTEQKPEPEPVAVQSETTGTKPTLGSIIARRRSWAPAYPEWYGKRAPDFTVTDINGKTHTLSQYKGKNVMLIFWATWCGPCIQEIPALIELRKTIGEDKLAMLGISYVDARNSTEKVKKFVADNPIINYTIISTYQATMPAPYNSIYSIPTTFFINPDGTIKIATEGMTPYSQIKAILEADM